MDIIIDFLDYFIKNLPTITTQLTEHIFLTFISVLIALLIGIPLGISVYYYKRTSKFVLGFANVIQAIPSIALLGFLIPILGIGMLPAIVGVTMYSLLPIIKNTYIGVSGVRPETLEAAKGMGLTKAQILTKIQVPIALPVIMAGVRIAAVTAVGMVTIAAFVGGGGLGTLIFAGIRTVNNNQVLLGAIPACILALLVDYIFGLVESKLSSRKVKKDGSKTIKYVIGVIIAIAVAIFAYNATKPKYDLTIGTKDFTEQIILGNIVADIIEDRTDLKVDRKTDLGGSNVVYEALLNNSIDMYVDYTGTVFINIMQRSSSSDVDLVYKEVKDFLANKNIYTGKQVGFNNTYTLAVLPETAKKYNLETISDLAKVADQLTASTTIEFANRTDGLPGLKKFYNFNFKNSIPVDGGQRFTAISTNKSDVIDAFSTDGLIKKFNLKTLKDDKKFFPPYYAIPLISQKKLQQYPELKEVLKVLENLITDKEMQEMNYLVDEKQQDPKTVAHDYLVNKKIIKK